MIEIINLNPPTSSVGSTGWLIVDSPVNCPCDLDK